MSWLAEHAEAKDGIETEIKLLRLEKDLKIAIEALKFYASGQHALSEFNDGGKARNALHKMKIKLDK
jgi:hypothetical protein